MVENSPAVLVRKAYKQYGRGTKAQTVFVDLNMTVPGGSIYGLLGASGCGKTTVLSCIVGCEHIDSGEIWVLGGKPGTKHSGVPGPRVGYMPQDVALVGEFTVKGAVQYFGWLCGMSSKEIDNEFMFLNQLLELPPEDRYIKNLSGGQKRRVSFAAALVQSPELLILDEPTVGLDPILRTREGNVITAGSREARLQLYDVGRVQSYRDCIWEHLLELAVNKHVTVIITTHYIEEAAQADKIGLLRGGRLLAEQHPRDLMASLNCSLGEVFFILSERQENSQLDTPEAEQLVENSMDAINQQMTNMHLPKSPSKSKYNVSSANRMKALLIKNFARIFRHIGGLCFLVLFPILQLVIFFSAIGGDPQGLKFAVVNQELHNASDCVEYALHNPTEPFLYPNLTCNFRGLSCNYLSRFNETKIYYSDLEEAKQSVKQGHTVGVLHFYANYSSKLQNRRELWRRASNETLEESSLIIYMDMSNQLIWHYTVNKLTEAYTSFAEHTFKTCNVSAKLANLPMQFNDPVYGDGKQNYAEFITPGLTVTMLFFLATSITATIIITERQEGVWDRSTVAGVKPAEILLSHITTQTFCMLLQLIVVLLLTFVVFKVPCLGNAGTMIFLLFLQGFCGMCYGFLVSSICDKISTGIYLALGSFYPAIFLSGTFWPTEGMPSILYYIAILMPCTIPVESLHDILDRGRSIAESQVYNGYLVTIVWIFLQIGMCLLVLRLKSK